VLGDVTEIRDLLDKVEVLDQGSDRCAVVAG